MSDPYFMVPASLLKGISDYLASRPYMEVAAAMRELAKLEPITKPSRKKETPA